MSQVQLIQVTPNELADIISENVKCHLKELFTEFKGSKKEEEQEFLTRKETAELFKVSLVTIHDWSNNGILKPYKLGNRTYYKYSELKEALFNSNHH
ncbi:MAG: helix-turn-helix domain-containing protein [Crocinitomicaceae bacterium]|jgi:hypothetical protein|nr:helix-turn-helix domain-containing protein [Crocinitomicaceae bacterium]MCF8444214.1 helix-turn-helix domain-containing protein [Crocinitomicaceae bacterium]